METDRQLTVGQLMVDSRRSNNVTRRLEENIPLIDRVIGAVAIHYAITVDDLIGPSRRADLVEARSMAAHLMSRHSELSYKAIAFAIGRTDHTTVLNCLGKIDNLMGQPHFRQKTEEIGFSLDATRVAGL